MLIADGYGLFQDSSDRVSIQSGLASDGDYAYVSHLEVSRQSATVLLHTAYCGAINAPMSLPIFTQYTLAQDIN